MTYYVDQTGKSAHVNYEPSSMGGLVEAPKPVKDYHQWVEGHLGPLTRRPRPPMTTARTRLRYRTFEEWEAE
jgi:catalase